MDELLLVIVICMTAAFITWLISRVVQEYFRAKAAKSKQMSAVRRGTTSRGVQRAEPAGWVTDLLEGLGHSADELYEDEMPDDLVKLLESPMVRGFLGSVGNKPETGQAEEPGTGFY
jgi:hypothetical protein